MTVSSFCQAAVDPSRPRLAAAVMASLLAFALVIVAAPAGVTEPIPTGTWINENPVAVGLQTSFRPAASSGCPKGMASTGAYKCLEVVKDGSGHGVMIRYGQSGDSGFGYLHMFIDHNLDLGPATHAIQQSAHGLKQANGRYLYGQYHVGAGGNIDQYVNVFEERGPAAIHDGHGLGVLTGYCQGPGHSFEAKCPDWVNETG